jgi:hypothetical protein
MKMSRVLNIAHTLCNWYFTKIIFSISSPNLSLAPRMLFNEETFPFYVLEFELLFLKLFHDTVCSGLQN